VLNEHALSTDQVSKHLITYVNLLRKKYFLNMSFYYQYSIIHNQVVKLSFEVLLINLSKKNEHLSMIIYLCVFEILLFVGHQNQHMLTFKNCSFFQCDIVPVRRFDIKLPS
jgi:hypothetical protein